MLGQSPPTLAAGFPALCPSLLCPGDGAGDGLTLLMEG